MTYRHFNKNKVEPLIVKHQIYKHVLYDNPNGSGAPLGVVLGLVKTKAKANSTKVQD